MLYFNVMGYFSLLYELFVAFISFEIIGVSNNITSSISEQEWYFFVIMCSNWACFESFSGMVHQVFTCQNMACIIFICIKLHIYKVLLILCVINMLADSCHEVIIFLTNSTFNDIDIWIVWYQRILLGVLLERTFTAQVWATHTITSILYQKTLVRFSFQRLSQFWWKSFNPNRKF